MKKEENEKILQKRKEELKHKEPEMIERLNTQINRIVGKLSSSESEMPNSVVADSKLNFICSNCGNKVIVICNILIR